MKVLIEIDEALYNYILDGTLNEVNHAVKNGVVLDKATNGDVVKTMFPNLELRQSYDLSGLFNILEDFQNVTFYEHWWNAPYKGGIDE